MSDNSDGRRPMDEPTSGKVTMAAVMTYVAEQFDKLRAEMCEGFDKLAVGMAEARKDFVTHHELDSALATVRAEIQGAVETSVADRRQLRTDLTVVQGQVSDIIKLVYKAVGIGVVLGIVFGAAASAAVQHLFS